MEEFDNDDDAVIGHDGKSKEKQMRLMSVWVRRRRLACSGRREAGKVPSRLGIRVLKDSEHKVNWDRMFEICASLARLAGFEGGITADKTRVKLNFPLRQIR
jgi:hypothetical protein